jgi:hypothetical protein
MHVVTFYSYKGGVGRTMALVNVAVSLAKAGKRVLLVDFDLEAPGLPSFDILSPGRGRRGIVDFIEEYRAGLVAPDVSDYLVKCDHEDMTLWLMTAGDNSSPEYTGRLNAIDWERLYLEEDGYLLIEDLRNQWADFEGAGFDYVFVDSRTGHTDVGGICTRQLPDAVAIMYVPNDQNVDGLVPIVKAIRKQAVERARPIELHFCPSNVPDEYDEDSILEKLLATASRKLEYDRRIGIDQPATIIYHRTSLELLTEPVVALTKQRTKLAKEYSELKDAIISKNFSDLDGALTALDRMADQYESARNLGKAQISKSLVEDGSEILQLHPRNARVAILAGDLFQVAGEYELDVHARTRAIDLGDHSNRAYLGRAISCLNLGRTNEAMQDLTRILHDPDATAFDYSPALHLFLSNSDDYEKKSLELFESSSVSIGAKKILSQTLMMNRAQLSVVADQFSSIARMPSVLPKIQYDLFNIVALALIGSHRFADAVEICDLQSQTATDRREGQLAIDFNRCMALWGIEGTPPLELFAQVSKQIASGAQGDANAHQCFALVRSIVGKADEALVDLDEALLRIVPRRPVFSCWRFLYVTEDTFRADIEEMRAGLVAGNRLVPPFLNEAAGLEKLS